MIYHITTKEDWQNAIVQGWYKPANFASEGFIHTSYDEQVKGVLERYYSGKLGLVKLHIDTDKVTSEIRYELSPSINEVFPHIYGALNTEAVVEVSDVV